MLDFGWGGVVEVSSVRRRREYAWAGIHDSLRLIIYINPLVSQENNNNSRNYMKTQE